MTEEEILAALTGLHDRRKAPPGETPEEREARMAEGRKRKALWTRLRVLRLKRSNPEAYRAYIRERDLRYRKAHPDRVLERGRRRSKRIAADPVSREKKNRYFREWCRRHTDRASIIDRQTRFKLRRACGVTAKDKDFVIPQSLIELYRAKTLLERYLKGMKDHGDKNQDDDGSPE